MSGRNKPRKRPDGYWKNDANVKKECQAIERDYLRIASRLSRPPSYEYLNKCGRGNLAYLIVAYYPGSFEALRRKLGLAHLRHGDNYWTNDVIEREYQELSRRLGHSPSSQEIGTLLPRLQAAICKFYPGQLNGLRKCFGEEIRKRSSVKDPRWIENEYKILASRVGHPPNLPQLARLDGGLRSAIVAYYPGGMRGLRSTLGLAQARKPNNHFRSWENVEAELREWVLEHGHPITDKRLLDTGYHTVRSAIQKYHGGMNAVKARLGIVDDGVASKQTKHRRHGYWMVWENVEQHVRSYIRAHGHFPAEKELKVGRHISVLVAIRAQGGFTAVREKMGYKGITEEEFRGHATTLTRVLLTLRKTRAQLTSDDLWSAIKRNWYTKNLEDAVKAFESKGGVSAFRRLLALK